MKLYRVQWHKNAWVRSYNISRGFVIRAASEEAARKLAAANADGGSEFENIPNTPYDGPREAWLDPKLTSCELVSEQGAEEIILHAFSSD